MRDAENTDREIVVDGARYNERELAGLIRRRMITHVKPSKRVYKRHQKHKNQQSYDRQ